jgi:hypothetical protein
MRIVPEGNVHNRLQCMRKRRRERRRRKTRRRKRRSQNIERVKALLLTKLSTD